MKLISGYVFLIILGIFVSPTNVLAIGEGPFLCKFDKAKGFLLKSGEYGESDDQINLRIDKIDYKMKKAWMSGNVGGSEVSILKASNGVNFIEETFIAINLTTIFQATTGDNDEYYAVTSRHTLIMGEPIIVQFPGKCKVVSR